MKRKIDIKKVKEALAGLDELIKEHPELTGPEARQRLTGWLEEEEKEMGRGKKEAEELQTIFVRMPADLVTGLDRYVQKMAEETPGLRPSRSDAIRALLYKALEAEEQGKG